ncbi:hypothetical protein PMAYCL1PPCAC_14169, partial [Pristionchus mayeri]
VSNSSLTESIKRAVTSSLRSHGLESKFELPKRFIVGSPKPRSCDIYLNGEVSLYFCPELDSCHPLHTSNVSIACPRLIPIGLYLSLAMVVMLCAILIVRSICISPHGIDK